MSRMIEITRKVLARCEIDASTQCWIWQGPTSGDGRGGGYPRMNLEGATVAVHRVMYTHTYGYIPPKKQVDHICRNRCCVNPLHLELITHKENQRRRDAAGLNAAGSISRESGGTYGLATLPAPDRKPVPQGGGQVNGRPQKLSWRFDPQRLGLSAETPFGPITVRRLDCTGIEVVADFLRPSPMRYARLGAAQRAALEMVRIHALTEIAA